jgi:hypothetical protein
MFIYINRQVGNHMNIKNKIFETIYAKIQEVAATNANAILSIDPGGISSVGDSDSFTQGYVGKQLVQNPSGAAFNMANKETRLGMGFRIDAKDYDAASKFAKQHGVNIDDSEKPFQSLNKARQNERIKLVREKGLQMGLLSPDSPTGIENLPISQNANPQTVLDSPLNKWLWDNIRNPEVGFAKQNQDQNIQEDVAMSVQPNTQNQFQKSGKPKQDFSRGLGLVVDPITAKKAEQKVKSAGVKSTGNTYKDLTAANQRIEFVKNVMKNKYLRLT